jgi:nucleoside 2-deoxyribosyltransferase
LKVFLAAPFTSFLKKKGIVDAKFHNKLQKIIDVISQSGHTVLSSHLRENWGRDLLPPQEIAPLDFSLIKECDLMIAYLNNQPSGVFVELGWASALKKRIVILTETPVAELSPLVQGLSFFSNATFVFFRSEKEMVKNLQKILAE